MTRDALDVRVLSVVRRLAVRVAVPIFTALALALGPAPTSAQAAEQRAANALPVMARWYNVAASRHWTSTAPPPGTGYIPQNELGATMPFAGEGRGFVMSCTTADADQFVTWADNCEGKTVLGKLGFAALTGDGPTVQTYRCNPNYGSHYLSWNAACPDSTPTRAEGANALLLQAQGALRSMTYNGDKFTSTGSTPIYTGRGAVLGFALRADTPGTRPISFCEYGDRQLAYKGSCPQGSTEFPAGSVWTSSQPGSAALYSCADTGNDHFDSTTPGCGGATVTATLGYIATTQPLLSRVRNVATGEQHATVGLTSGDEYVEHALGYPAATSGSGRTSLLLCGSSSEQHLSTGNCDTTKVADEGYVWTTPPTGVDSAPLWQCTTSSSGDRWEDDSPCTAGTSKLLGYLTRARWTDPMVAPATMPAAVDPGAGGGLAEAPLADQTAGAAANGTGTENGSGGGGGEAAPSKPNGAGAVTPSLSQLPMIQPLFATRARTSKSTLGVLLSVRTNGLPKAVKATLNCVAGCTGAKSKRSRTLVTSASGVVHGTLSPPWSLSAATKVRLDVIGPGYAPVALTYRFNRTKAGVFATAVKP